MKVSLQKAALAAAVLAASGCGVRGELYTALIQSLPLLGASSAVVQVVPQTRRAVVLTPGQPAPTAITLSKSARAAFAVPGSDEVMVLAGTTRAPLLDVVNVASGEQLTVELPGFFDRVRFSPDGLFGVLAYNATGTPGSSGTAGALVARNLNEVGLLNVNTHTVTRLQLDTESLAPRDILFGPAEPNRQLVAVTLDRGVAVFDALHPEVAPRRISIRPTGSTSESAVQQALFSRNAQWLFLRASGLDDVVVVELGPEIGTPVAASINFVAGGRGLSDIAVPPLGFEDTVLAAFPASSQVFLLDARGIQDNNRSLDGLAAFRTVTPLSGNKVLLVDTASRAVGAWDIADGRSGLVQLDGTPGFQVVLADLDKAAIAHASTAAGAGSALSVVTVQEETNRLRVRVQAIQLASPLATTALDPVGHRLFFTVGGQPSVVTLDLVSLALAEVPLDATAGALHFLPAVDMVAVEHRTPFVLGDVTLVPAGATERGQAVRFTDFALTGDLDRSEETR